MDKYYILVFRGLMMLSPQMLRPRTQHQCQLRANSFNDLKFLVFTLARTVVWSGEESEEELPTRTGTSLGLQNHSPKYINADTPQCMNGSSWDRNVQQEMPSSTHTFSGVALGLFFHLCLNHPINQP